MRIKALDKIRDYDEAMQRDVHMEPGEEMIVGEILGGFLCGHGFAVDVSRVIKTGKRPTYGTTVKPKNVVVDIHAKR